MAASVTRRCSGPEHREDLLFLTGLIEAGQLTPVVSRGYPLGDAGKVRGDADEGHGYGKTVITVWTDKPLRMTYCQGATPERFPYGRPVAALKAWARATSGASAVRVRSCWPTRTSGLAPRTPGDCG